MQPPAIRYKPGLSGWRYTLREQMRHLLEFVLEHGYSVLFGFVLAEQLGLPLPAVPVLLAVGALIGRGDFGLPHALAVATIAAVLADLFWYALGRLRGRAVIELLCRFSLEPDSCVRRTSDAFTRFGLRSLLIAKFIPGWSTAAPPVAGMTRVAVWRFVAWDAAGSLVWSAGFLAVGVAFSTELERAAEWAVRLGSWLLLLLLGALAAYLAFKYEQRRRFLRSLRVARIKPEEVKRKLESGEPLAIIDLRHAAEFAADGKMLPGAMRLDPEVLTAAPEAIPRDRDVILYCS
jgi:membrane protein DedA with SNARE-associated domain